jgi:hypothetical protein
MESSIPLVLKHEDIPHQAREILFETVELIGITNGSNFFDTNVWLQMNQAIHEPLHPELTDDNHDSQSLQLSLKPKPFVAIPAPGPANG